MTILLTSHFEMMMIKVMTKVMIRVMIKAMIKAMINVMIKVMFFRVLLMIVRHSRIGYRVVFLVRKARSSGHRCLRHKAVDM